MLLVAIESPLVAAAGAVFLHPRLARLTGQFAPRLEVYFASLVLDLPSLTLQPTRVGA